MSHAKEAMLSSNLDQILSIRTVQFPIFQGIVHGLFWSYWVTQSCDRKKTFCPIYVFNLFKLQPRLFRRRDKKTCTKFLYMHLLMNFASNNACLNTFWCLIYVPLLIDFWKIFLPPEIIRSPLLINFLQILILATVKFSNLYYRLNYFN